MGCGAECRFRWGVFLRGEFRVGSGFPPLRERKNPLTGPPPELPSGATPALCLPVWLA